jgi:hypothetical protein
MRMRVAAGRARTRTSVRVIVTATVAMAGALVLVNRGELGGRPGDPVAQIRDKVVEDFGAAHCCAVVRLRRGQVAHE